LKTTSDKIRALDRAGWARQKIADALKIRYQHVRNVLVQDEARAARAASAQSDSRRHPQPPKPTKIRLGPDGRVVVPASFREALGLKEGDVLFGSVEDGEIHLLTTPAAMRRAQALVRQFVPEGVSLVDELIEDRRREAEREAGGG
jgi:AbrB family looped-hinge helix DNA binding protein